MEGLVRIDVDLLEEVFSILVRHLRELEGGEVRLDNDYYWSIPPEKIYDIDTSPTGLDVGQITECLEWLSALAKDPQHALTYQFVWLADVLRAVGQSIVR